jgi:hypothetical protein
MVTNSDLPISTRRDRPGVYLELVVVLLLLAFAALRPIGFDSDSIAYQKILEEYYSTENINLSSFEPTFFLIALLSKWFFFSSIRFVLIMYALIGVPLNIYAIKKVSARPDLSIFIYMCLYFVLHEMTQMRAGVACALFLLSIPDAVEQRPSKYFIKIALASMFHYSAVIALPMYFLHRKNFNKTFYLLLPLIGILTSKVINFDLLERTGTFSPKIVAYITFAKMGQLNPYNIFNLYSIGLLVLYYPIVIFADRLKYRYDAMMLKVFGFMLFVYFAISLVPTFAVRFSEFLGIVLVVLLAQATEIVKESSVMKFAVILFALAELLNLLLKQHLLHI